MGSGSGGQTRDSVLYRTDRNVGFNARVEPLWSVYEQLAPRMGFFRKLRERRRTKRLVSSIDTSLKSMGTAPDGWSEKTGRCVCHLRVARMGLVSELKRTIKNFYEGDAASKWPHLMALRDGASMAIPQEFARPIEVSLGRRRSDAPAVASARRLQDELESVNERMGMDKMFRILRKVDFLDATERDISIYETRFGDEEGFWAKFAYALLRKLAGASLEHRLPVILV